MGPEEGEELGFPLRGVLRGVELEEVVVEGGWASGWVGRREGGGGGGGEVGGGLHAVLQVPDGQFLDIRVIGLEGVGGWVGGLWISRLLRSFSHPLHPPQKTRACLPFLLLRLSSLLLLLLLLHLE